MFYAKDGWYFERLENGSVRICRRVYPAQGWAAPAEVMAEVVLDANVWASVIASVSAKGEENGRFYEVLEFHNDVREESDPTSNMLIRDDMNLLLQEIKNYTNQYPGEIHPADIQSKLMLGFVHDDGTYWGIRLSDIKKSLSSIEEDYQKKDVLRMVMSTADGKKNLCAILSNVKKEK